MVVLHESKASWNVISLFFSLFLSIRVCDSLLVIFPEKTTRITRWRSSHVVVKPGVSCIASALGDSRPN